MRFCGRTVKSRLTGRWIDDIYRNIRNRSEASLFKTVEEAEKYCVEVNTKKVSPEF